MAIRIIQDAPREPTAVEDYRNAIMSGLNRGVAGVAGAAGDLYQGVTGIPQFVGGFLEKKGVEGAGDFGRLVTQTTRNQGKQDPRQLLAQAISATGAATGKQAAKAVNAPPALQDAAAAGGRLAGGPRNAPTSADLSKGSGYRPKRTGAKYAQTIATMAPNALMPGGAGTRLASVLVPGVMSEAAGQLTEGKPYEGLARAGGALAGGLGVSLASQMGSADRIISEAAANATDDQIAAARALQEDALKRGVNLTQAEAIQQVTGGATGLGRMQAVMENTPAGRTRFGPMMAERPNQVMGAVQDYAQTLGPARDPGALGLQIQGQADSALNRIRQGINEQAREHYQALAGQQLPDEAFQTLRADPAFARALSDVRNDAILNRGLENLPDNNLSVLNEVTKRARQLEANYTPTPGSLEGSMQHASAYGQAAGSVSDVAAQVSPDWQTARDIVSSGRRETLDPLTVGPLGKMAKTPDLGSQLGARFPTKPLEGAAEQGRQATALLGRDLTDAMLRQHVMSSANEAMQNLQSGPNQWGGAKLAAVIAGNPEQRRTLMSAAPDSNNLEGLLQTLEATGMRHQPGSMTAYNLEDLKNLGTAGPIGSAVETVVTLPRIASRIGEALQNAQARSNVNRLADILLADPAQAEQLLLKARANGTTPATEAARLAAILAESQKEQQ